MIRLKADVLSYPAGNVCYSLATIDSGEDDEYFLEIDDGSNAVDADGFARNYVTVTEPTFVVQREKCSPYLVTQGELGMMPFERKTN